MTEQNVTFNHCVYMGNICPPYIDKYLADYDATGRLPGYTNFNGTATAFGYDNASRLTSIRNEGQRPIKLMREKTKDKATGCPITIKQYCKYISSAGGGVTK
ncbi:MAG: hypothetical protein A4E71_00179 [Smithella sp. PtaU1.Bin162]|nr:MAG: hypothetical protein A4E71_00179 [Smithella sp. PtaU1.Bin162]